MERSNAGFQIVGEDVCLGIVDVFGVDFWCVLFVSVMLCSNGEYGAICQGLLGIT